MHHRESFGQLGPYRIPGDSQVLWGSQTLPLRQGQSPRTVAVCTKGRRIVVDVDGLLINSEPWILTAILESLQLIAQEVKGKDYRLTTDDIEDIKRTCFGVSDDEMSKRVQKWMTSRELAPAWISEKSEREFIETFRLMREETYIGFARDGYIRPMPGAVEFLQRAFDLTGSLGINTGSPSRIQRQVLSYVLGPLIDIDRICPEYLRVYVDTPGNQGKPHPAGYQIAASRMGVEPHELIAVEDRANGALSALRAGYRFVICVPENLECRSLFQGKNAMECGPSECPPRFAITPHLDTVVLF